MARPPEREYNNIMEARAPHAYSVERYAILCANVIMRSDRDGEP